MYKPGKELYIADTLSRAYQQADESDYNEYDVMNIEVLSNTRLDELKTETKKDHTCNVLATLINKGWPDTYSVIPKEAQPYYLFPDELSMSNDIIMRGHRFMIPKSLQTYYVEQLHKGHPGIKSTKQRASCCLPTPMTLASGGSPMFPLVVHQPASPSIWPAV